MSGGIGARFLVMVFGAGAGGSYLYTNRDEVSSMARNVSRATIHELSRPGADNVPAGTLSKGPSWKEADAYKSSISELSTQVNKLTSQISRQDSERPAVMVVSGPESDESFVPQIVLPAMLVVLGTTAIVMHRKGVTWADVLGVTQKTFAKSVDRMQGGLTAAYSKLTVVRSELLERLWQVEKKLQLTSRELKTKIEGTVGDARNSVDEVGQQIESLQDSLRGMENQFGSIDNSMQFAVRGVHMLCSYVAEIGNLSTLARSELTQFLGAIETSGDLPKLEAVSIGSSIQLSTDEAAKER
eukprot:CAMPEP_0184740196 /NCGR_PEP_ID=MMETSP0315-20130426/3209_1 /TAXON_ID=101924 /ORGANISM="Rhodosorus marinus, Strain UTEX LB 2760" /LENGTH=298 /DNA_ID=CAMNT_0027209721 /DNA_START=46 /DNA_END=942 /DNA_ORIENTATION=-